MSSNKVLIDSHVLIWLLYEPDKINVQAKNLLEESDYVYLSGVSLWELSLKFSKNKLVYSPAELIKGAQALNLDRLPLKDEHIMALTDINLVHKDPFDSLLIAQSEAENCVFLTADSYILDSAYSTFKI